VPLADDAASAKKRGLKRVARIVKTLKIGCHTISRTGPCFIVAEAGVNHNGDLTLAKKLVEQAKAAGADAVKFQTFSPHSVITEWAPKADYQRLTTDASESQLEMLRKLQLTHEEFRTLKRHADRVGITFFSTPHDERDVDFLMALGVPALKVASMDLVNYPLIEHVAKQGLPVIVSTGMASLGETETALQVLEQGGCACPLLLHCVTNYPIRDDEANLRVMDTLTQAFDVLVGFSDHTVGTAIAIAAVARGAVAIEKHFTLDRALPGPDHAASLDPDSFARMVAEIRSVERAVGSQVKHTLPVEVENRKAMRRSLVAATDIEPGTVLTREHLTMKRPGTGLGAEWIPRLVGRTVRCLIRRNSLVSLDMFMS